MRHLKNCKDRLARMDSTRLARLAFRYRLRVGGLEEPDIYEKTKTPCTLKENSVHLKHGYIMDEYKVFWHFYGTRTSIFPIF
jgi:hypothetical protein